jgi:hypothetical protein
MITKEQFKTLQPFEQHLKTAKLGYIRGVYHSDIQMVLPIYHKLGYKLANPNCADCVLTMFKVLGNEYDKYIKKNGNKTE